MDTLQPSEAASTPDRLTSAVERLLAERHDLSVSLREITSAAGANVASVNYHFGSKAALVDTVIERALSEHARAQLDALDAVAGSGRRPSVEELVWAWLAPTIQAVTEGRPTLITRVAANVAGGGSPHLRQLLASTHAAVHRRLAELLAPHVPQIDAAEVSFRVETAATLTMWAVLGLVSTPPPAQQPADQRRRGAERIVAFLVGGLTAPPARRPGRAAGSRARVSPSGRQGARRAGRSRS